MTSRPFAAGVLVRGGALVDVRVVVLPVFVFGIAIRSLFWIELKVEGC